MLRIQSAGSRRLTLLLLGLALLGLAQLPYVANSQDQLEAVLPEGFNDSLVTLIKRPTALAFLPDGRALVAQQSGILSLVDPGDGATASVALDLVDLTCSNLDRGLLGLAVDPQFAANRFVYVYYTFKKYGACSISDATLPNPPVPADAPVHRVSRFTLPPSNLVDRASELVLVDNMPSPSGMHNAGDLQFGKDGYLYISTGDGACDYRSDSGCGRLNDSTRDQHHLLGKILRITSSGGIPAGNPYIGADSARCNVSGSTTPGKKCQETFNWGLRNPFRIAFDPNASGTRFFINDVGHGSWEEIDLGIAGADYGWNGREGHCLSGSTVNCPAPPAGVTDPIHDYLNAPDNTVGCASITGGAFVPNGLWPAEYNNGYLYSDYACGTIFLLKPGPSGGYAAAPFMTELGRSSAVHLTFGPDGAGKALYYTTFAGGGQVRRIRYSGSANVAPTAGFTANRTYGAAPLTVTFDAGASSDPNPGDVLTYLWDFGNGVKTETATPKTSYAYTANGVFNASVRVRDAAGLLSASATPIRIDVGNTPPTPQIVAPALGKLFRVGEAITLQGRAGDTEDGQLKDAALTWEILLHHNTHTHTFLPPTTGNNLVITAPPPEDVDAAVTSFLMIRLTATDSTGRKTTVSQVQQPHRIKLTLATQPAGLNLVVDGAVVKTPATIVSWEGYQIGVTAAAQTDSSGQTLQFVSWSDGNTSATRTVVTPGTATTLTAAFQPGQATRRSAYLPLVNR